jgi:hypothetical protein
MLGLAHLQLLQFPGAKGCLDYFYHLLRFLRYLLFRCETDSMHPQFARADRLSAEVIGAAIEVHRIMGPG